MKKITTLLLLFFVATSFAQKNKFIKNKVIETKVTSIFISANSIEELKTINWLELKESFNDNKQNDIIKLGFEIDLKESKNKLKNSITISGETKNLESLILKAKKGVKGLIKMTNNYQNK